MGCPACFAQRQQPPSGSVSDNVRVTFLLALADARLVGIGDVEGRLCGRCQILYTAQVAALRDAYARCAS